MIGMDSNCVPKIPKNFFQYFVRGPYLGIYKFKRHRKAPQAEVGYCPARMVSKTRVLFGKCNCSKHLEDPQQINFLNLN